MQDTSRSSTFSGQVLVLFSSRILAAGVGIINGILLARLLGPAAKGDYTFIVLLPASAIVLVQLGLPQAFGYFSARGQTLGIFAKSVVLTVVPSAVAVVGLLVVLQFVRDALPKGVELRQILVALVALPLALNVTFTTGIVTGRKAIRWYAGVNAAYPIASTVLLAICLGWLGLAVNGALAVYLVATAIQSIGLAIGARRAAAANRHAESVSYQELFGYALPYYPASLAGFFSYRVDVYLIAFLMADSSASIGYYSLAVGLAEMAFFFSGAVSTMFFPHVAGAPREESNRQVAMVSRVTLLVTGMFALLLIPAAALMIWVLLPAFGPSFPALLVLLPGVVALSAANVVGGYITGIGRPGVHSSVNVLAFVVNIIANLIFIPPFGIVGASAASLLSYSLSALLTTAIAARFAGVSVGAFWIVGVSDIRYAVETGLNTLRRILARAASARESKGSGM
jgi:O-antigen/teichoic acid export membrane protein